MSHRSSAADAGERRRETPFRLCASALVILAMIWTGAPVYVRADTIVLKTGEEIEGRSSTPRAIR